MDWTDIAPFLVIVGVIGTMWWRLDSKIDRKFDQIMTALLTMSQEIGDLKGSIGELKGQAHTHTQEVR